MTNLTAIASTTRRRLGAVFAVLALVSVSMSAQAGANRFVGHGSSGTLGVRTPTTHVISTHRATKPALSGATKVASFTRATWGYSSPGGKKLHVIQPTCLGSPLITPIVATLKGYYLVRLPMRPNGSTIWVKAPAVLVSSTPYRIVINIKSMHLWLLRYNRVVFGAPVGVGVAADPTPTGNYFVTFYAATENAGYGPWMLVTSAHSNTIRNWGGSGDAFVSIHGPLGADRQIGTTGTHISHGCIRMHLADELKLKVVHAGTPITIVG